MVPPPVGVRTSLASAPGLTCRVELPVLPLYVPVTMWSIATVAVQVSLEQEPSSGLIERVVDPVTSLIRLSWESALWTV